METTQKPYAFSRKVFCEGMRDGVPIALGYFAVSFSLGIAARNAGLTPIQGFFASLFNNASAGEYAAFSLIAAGATYLEVAIILITLTNLQFHRNFCPDFFFDVQILQYIGRNQNFICFLGSRACARRLHPKLQLGLIRVINFRKYPVGVGHDLNRYPTAHLFKHGIFF